MKDICLVYIMHPFVQFSYFSLGSQFLACLVGANPLPRPVEAIHSSSRHGGILVFLKIACYTPNGSEVMMPLYRPNKCGILKTNSEVC
jgi:hypothetical protein